MTKRMLIDATHAEETRVAVVDGNKLVEFDYESKVRKQLKSSIFLAKVTRVEPSLQAAFVNFGGNRHGFLPFSEVHPDYYRIPMADREALIAEQLAEMEERRRAEEELDREEERGMQQQAQDSEQPAHDHHEHDDHDHEEAEMIEEVGGNTATPEITDDVEEEGASEEDAGPTAYIAAKAPETVLYAEPEAEESLSQDQVEGERESGMPSESEAPSPIGEQNNDEGQEQFHDHAAESFADEFGGDFQQDAGDDQTRNENAAEFEQSGEQNGENGGEGRRDRGDRNRGRGRGRGRGGRDRGGRGGMRGRHSGRSDSRAVESVGGDGIEGDYSRPTSRRHYKIQEVVKRGQIMLVQVSKEERGNKGAAVTTYLSLPGRYCVLMPNSPRGGGVSRKIASFQERRRMRELLTELQVPEGMSVIMRTAGVSRTKPEIKRDLDYLLRLWDEIRETTLASTAPAAIHEEGNLVRRSIRDIYTSEIEEVLVAGDDGYKFARDFMKMMIPSHAKRVKQYKDDKVPLFNRYGIENQIKEMSEPNVTLKSGGYLVINPTEALVSIDVNSGRATKERHIEETAVKTNLEAADEVARQLRLRDLGGLVVVDFIDMEDRRNNRRVEERLKQALSSDRARIQVGRISSFGLLELSRQRLNPSLTEAQFEKCPHCRGVGVVRTTDSAAIFALRALEEEGARNRAAEVHLFVPSAVALYIFNNKREMINDLERRYGFRVVIEVDENVDTGGYRIESVKGALLPREDDAEDRVQYAESTPEEDEAAEEAEESSDGEGQEMRRSDNRNDRGERQEDGNDRQGRRRGRRGGRRRRGGRDREDRANGMPGNDGPVSDEVDFEPAGEGMDIDDEINGNVLAPEPVDIEGNHDRPHREGGREGGSREGRNRNRRGGRNRGGRGGRDGGRDGNREGGRRDFHGPADSHSSENASSGQDATVGQFEPASQAQSPRAFEPQPEHQASNDAAPPARDYERVNEAPAAKKKGWWNKLTE